MSEATHLVERRLRNAERVERRRGEQKAWIGSEASTGMGRAMTGGVTHRGEDEAPAAAAATAAPLPLSAADERRRPAAPREDADELPEEDDELPEDEPESLSDICGSCSRRAKPGG